MRTLAALALTAILLGVSATVSPGAGEALTPDEVQLIFDEFLHEEHEETFTEEGVSCVACHQVGARLDEPLPASELVEAFITPPPASCHYCHKPTDSRKAVGPEGCQICHGEGFAPDSHGPGWATFHGGEVRMIRPGCHECHDTGRCLTCHENRGALTRSTHPPGWGAVHGVEARFDPQSCVTCHAGGSCVQCHQSGRSPW